MRPARSVTASYIRNFIFGVEDSLVSTVGLLSGIAIAGVPRGTIFLTGVVLVLVEAFSMAAGSFLSEASAEEYQGKTYKNVPLIDGTIMFFSYVIAGLVPLFPYLVFPVERAFVISIALALIALLGLGMFGALFINHQSRNILRRGLRMLVIGGLAILVGVAAGNIVGV